MQKTDEALGRILNQLADKFGTTVEHLYGILLKQAFIDGIENLVAVVIFSILFATLAIKSKKWTEKENRENPDYGWDFDDNPALIAGTVVSGVVWLSVVLMCGTQLIDAFFNPEYYALHQILK